jgi:hypothetical protein
MRWVNEMAQNETNRGAANKLTASLKRTKQQTEYEQEVVMDRETKAKSTKISRDILNDIINTSFNQSDARQNAASTSQAATKRTRPAPKMIKEHYKKVDASAKLQATMRGTIQRKQDRAVTNLGNLTDILNETAI